MAETQTVIRLDRDLYRTFKGYCVMHNTTPTKEFEAFVKKRVAQWSGQANRGRETSGPQNA